MTLRHRLGSRLDRWLCHVREQAIVPSACIPAKSSKRKPGNGEQVIAARLSFGDSWCTNKTLCAFRFFLWPTFHSSSPPHNVNLRFCLLIVIDTAINLQAKVLRTTTRLKVNLPIV